MTTIAANHLCMAADRHYSLEGCSFKAPKLWVHEGSIWSSAGYNADWIAFQRYIIGLDKERPTLKGDDEFSVLRLSADGLFYYDWSCHPTRIDNEHFAIGNGQLAAICLMSVGVSPKDAVSLICEHDDGTKGPVDCIFLTDIVKPARAKRAC